MVKAIDRLAFGLLMIAVIGLTTTALPTLSGTHLAGWLLLAHMAFSGLLVVTLPILALVRLQHHLRIDGSSRLAAIGYWSVLLMGFATIATMFISMLPFPSTQQMNALISWHGYAGFALAVATILILVGQRNSSAKHDPELVSK